MHVIYQETERPELLYHGVLQSEVTPGYHETEHLTTGTISFRSLDIDKEMQCYAKMKFMSEFDRALLRSCYVIGVKQMHVSTRNRET